MIAATTATAHLSFSQLRTYVECPKKWHFEKVVHAEPERMPVSLAYGASAHDAAEAANFATMAGEKVDAAAVFEESWSAFTAPGAIPLAVDDDEEGAALLAKGRAMMAIYQPPPGIVAVEQEISVELHPDLPPLVGRIDVLRQTDAGLVVADVKTSSTRVLSDTEMLSAQLGFYGMAYAVVRSEAIVLFKGKVPAQTVQAVEPWPERRLRTWATEIFHAMSSGVAFAHRSRNCRTCQFRDRCAAES